MGVDPEFKKWVWSENRVPLNPIGLSSFSLPQIARIGGIPYFQTHPNWESKYIYIYKPTKSQVDFSIFSPFKSQFPSEGPLLHACGPWRPKVWRPGEKGERWEFTSRHSGLISKHIVSIIELSANWKFSIKTFGCSQEFSRAIAV